MLANVQLKSFRLTMATMPWGAIAIAISAVAFKIMSAAEATKTLEKFQKELDATMGRLRASIMSEEVGLRLLFTRLKNVEKGSKDYLLIKNEIVRNYGDYMEGLEDEIEKTKDYDELLKRLLKYVMKQVLLYLKTTKSIWQMKLLNLLQKIWKERKFLLQQGRRWRQLIQ